MSLVQRCLLGLPLSRPPRPRETEAPAPMSLSEELSIKMKRAQEHPPKCAPEPRG